MSKKQKDLLKAYIFTKTAKVGSKKYKIKQVEEKLDLAGEILGIPKEKTVEIRAWQNKSKLLKDIKGELNIEALADVKSGLESKLSGYVEKAKDSSLSRQQQKIFKGHATRIQKQLQTIERSVKSRGGSAVYKTWSSQTGGVKIQVAKGGKPPTPTRPKSPRGIKAPKNIISVSSKPVLSKKSPSTKSIKVSQKPAKTREIKKSVKVTKKSRGKRPKSAKIPDKRSETDKKNISDTVKDTTKKMQQSSSSSPDPAQDSTPPGGNPYASDANDEVDEKVEMIKKYQQTGELPPGYDEKAMVELIEDFYGDNEDILNQILEDAENAKYIEDYEQGFLGKLPSFKKK